ncbi:hypothetical protein FACS1894200_11130 [Spirochaetia bacterium]|nr:hypothetical protein FACS1894200_11130 [Spirochaetia bacterium]
MSEIQLNMPFALILYWETTRKTPDKVTLKLKFEDGSLHNYEVSTLKMFDQSMEMLEQRKMMLLLLFCLLKKLLLAGSEHLLIIGLLYFSTARNYRCFHNKVGRALIIIQ